MKAIIIPDVHGRTFWKDAISKYPQEQYPDIKIIFLGDYLDPYTSIENISKEDAYNNFLEILELINNDSRVVPLIGNHDWHYFVNLDTCRIDKARERDIEKLFKDNISKFRLTYTIEINGKKYIFTHAGITQGWLDDIAISARYEIDQWNHGGVDKNHDEKFLWMSELRLINESYNFELLEECLKHYDDSFYSGPMSMISRERGGWNAYGSCIWADISEHVYDESNIGDYYQIFAHTITYPKYIPIIPEDRNWAMLDCGHAFTLDDENRILIVK